MEHLTFDPAEIRDACEEIVLSPAKPSRSDLFEELLKRLRKNIAEQTNSSWRDVLEIERQL